MCITGSFLKQNKHPQNVFHLRWAELKGILPNFFFARGEQDKKQIPEMCTTGGHLKVTKHAHMKTNLQFQDLCFFFQGDILQTFSRLWRAKIIGKGDPYQKTCITSRKITFSSQTKKCGHLTAFWEKKLKIKNEKKKKFKGLLKKKKQINSQKM